MRFSFLSPALRGKTCEPTAQVASTPPWLFPTLWLTGWWPSVGSDIVWSNLPRAPAFQMWGSDGFLSCMMVNWAFLGSGPRVKLKPATEVDCLWLWKFCNWLIIQKLLIRGFFKQECRTPDFSCLNVSSCHFTSSYMIRESSGVSLCPSFSLWCTVYYEEVPVMIDFQRKCWHFQMCGKTALRRLFVLCNLLSILGSLLKVISMQVMGDKIYSPLKWITTDSDYHV